MVYTPNPPRFRNVQTELDISTFPAGASFLVFSLWAYSNSAEFAILINDTTASASGNLIFFQVDCGSGAEDVAVTIKSGANIGATGNNIILNGEISAAVEAACYCHWLISVDLAGNRFQAYFNDQEMTLNSSIAWGIAGRSFAATNADTVTTEQTVWPPASDFQSKYFSDLWIGSTASFFDLSIEANRRKFINADITPVDLGATGQIPFGTAPQIFQNVLPAGTDPLDWLINRGTVGGTFIQNTGTLFLEGNPCAPAGQTAELLDLWFAPTDGFVDLRGQSERRKFIGLDGSTAYLGADGSRPFGTVPPIFLTLQDDHTANDFALNQGSGGAFAITGGDLTDGSGRPPCGDYTVPLGVDPNTPQGADPQIMLSVSDDGGRTFGLLQKWRSMGKIGEYEKRLRWLKLGQFRERQIRLEVTDPVRRNIIGVYVDVSQGLE